MIVTELGATPDWLTLRDALEAGAGPAAVTLTPRLVAALEDSDIREALKKVLAETGRSMLVARLDDATLPGWTRPYRAALAVGAAELLADLNPQRTRGWVLAAAPEGATDQTAYLIRVAAFCHDLQLQTRRVICLCLHGAGPDLANRLSGEHAVGMLAGLAGIGPEEAQEALSDHLGLARRRDGGVVLPGEGRTTLVPAGAAA